MTIKRAWLGAMAAAVVLGALMPATASAEGTVVQAREHYAPGMYIVVLKEGVAATANASSIESSAAGLAAKYGGTLSATFTASLHGFSVRDLTERDARRLAADPSVRTVYEDGTTHGAEVQDVQPNPTWGIDRVDQRAKALDKKYEYNATGEGVTVYDIDSGARITHQDFEGRASHGYDFFDKDNDASDCNGHGTHTAGTAVGKTYGIAKKAKLVALRVFDCGNSGPDSVTVEAVEWVTKNGKKPAVVNMSLYQYDVGVGDEQIQASIRAGFVYAVAAGNNNGADACKYSPARVPEALTVASIDQGDGRSFFSNIGTCVDLFAPGGSITSLSHSSDTGTAGNSGTSMATPHVTGAAALYLQGHPNANQAEVNKAILDLTTPNAVGNAGNGSPNKLLYTKDIKADGGGNPTCGKQSNGDDVAIPDTNSAVTSAITVSGCDGNGSATATVEVSVVHPYRGDVALDLVAPDGSTYRLKDASGSDSGADINTTYTVNLSSEARNGTWKLSAKDAYRGDAGRIDSWSLTL